MNDQVFAIVQITYTVALPVFLGYVTSMSKKHEKKSQAARKADCLLLRKALIDIHDAAVERGYITRSQFEEFQDVWTLYHEGFNGNTLTDQFKKEVDLLPIR